MAAGLARAITANRSRVSFMVWSSPIADIGRYTVVELCVGKGGLETVGMRKHGKPRHQASLYLFYHPRNYSTGLDPNVQRATFTTSEQ
jgi:hypothetical protein